MGWRRDNISVVDFAYPPDHPLRSGPVDAGVVLGAHLMKKEVLGEKELQEYTGLNWYY